MSNPYYGSPTPPEQPSPSGQEYGQYTGQQSTAAQLYAEPSPYASPYGPGAYGPPPDGYGQAPAGPPVQEAAPQQQPIAYHQGWTAKKASAFGMLELLGFIVLPIAFIAIVYIAGSGAAANLQLTAAALALVPLCIVLLAVRWVDRFEPEPRSALIMMFLWGGGAAALISFWVNTAAFNALLGSQGSSQADFTSSVIVAPLIEEFTKALGVLLLYFLRPRLIDGPVDGLAYAMVSAGGFAFTENILYFTGAAQAEATGKYGGGILLATFFMRGVMSPFAHATFTAMSGLAIGIAAARRNRGAVFATFPIGFAAAVGLHAAWNGAAVQSQDAFLTAYFSIQIPILLIMVGIVMFLRGRESATIRTRLSEYAQAGWFDANEVQMLSSLRLRRSARNWAQSVAGPTGLAAMKSFQSSAIRLAYDRSKIVLGRATPQVQAEEQLLLGRISEDRQRLHASMRR